MKNERAAKIVATIGPSCQDEETLRKLFLAGVNVARLNFSHGKYETHELIFHRIRKISKELNRSITILQDLQGPKIRVGEIINGQVYLEKDKLLKLTNHSIMGTDEIVSIDFPHMCSNVKPGDRILLDDGNLELQAQSIDNETIITRVVLGGYLKPHKGVNFPGISLDIAGFTQKDDEDLSFGLKLGVDAVAISFVRKPGDIVRVRQKIEETQLENKYLPVIAKLERPEALDNLEEIISVADGVMVARGDLGVEMAPESVPIAQKRIIALANQKGKFVITATQMLDSMINNPRPTRAEASDVANAIFDGTDAVMLSGETAVGKYPIQAVEMMDAIIRKAEIHFLEWGQSSDTFLPESDQDDTYFITMAARELAHDRNVTAITTFTKSGRTALMISKARPEVPILAFTPDSFTFHRLNLYWGVFPVLIPFANTIEEVIHHVDDALLSSSNFRKGQQVVLVCGFPIQSVRKTNLTLLHTVGE